MLKQLTGLLLMIPAALQAASFFPIDFGNTWTYRNSVTGRSFTMRVGTPVMTNGKVYFTLHGFVGSNIQVRTDETNTLVYLDNDTTEERPLLIFGSMNGMWLHAPFRPCEQESQAQDRRSTYNGPAGEFKDVLNVRYRSFGCADAGTEVEQYAENVGMVRRVEQTIAGSQSYDLVYARVGSAVYNALPHGSMSVTLDQVAGNDYVTAALRLRVFGPSINLHFPSAQEYDLELRDETGKVVWQWSDGRMFDQAGHDLNVSMEWSAAIVIPRPGNPAEPTNYTLHAWLTTDGPAPAYAASVPVQIYGPPVAQ